MARIVSGPYVAGQVTSRETGSPLGGVTVTISGTVYTDPEMTTGTTGITADGNGRYSFYAPPGNYTFTTNATNANPIEAVEVLGGELGTRNPGGAGGAAADQRWAASTAVVTGQIIEHSGTLYRSDANFTTPASFNTTNLTAISATSTGSVPFSQPGNAAVGASGAWTAPSPGSLVAVHLSCVTAAAGSDLAVDFKKNGTTFQTLTIAAGSTTPTSAAPVVTFVVNDSFTVSATSVGSGTAATGVVAQIDYQLT